VETRSLDTHISQLRNKLQLGLSHDPQHPAGSPCKWSMAPATAWNGCSTAESAGTLAPHRDPAALAAAPHPSTLRTA
jgi:hypothetical protein